MSLAASIPLRVGSPKSRRMMSGCNAVAVWTASRPSHASDAIVHSGRACKISWTLERQGSKSSTTRILAFEKIGSTISVRKSLVKVTRPFQISRSGIPLFSSPGTDLLWLLVCYLEVCDLSICTDLKYWAQPDHLD